MRARTIATILGLGLVAALVPAPATAGVDWFGIGISHGGFSFSLGYSDYPEYSDAWYNPSWSMNYDLMLDGYGEWVSVAGLGRVWRPWVASDWRPYTYGRWVWTSLGWTWVAYEPWGYVPSHYGDWAFTTFGWVWVPGYTYRPANVVWFTSGSLVGWMPCAPRGWSNAHRAFRRGYDRGYRHGYGDGYVDGWRDARYATWVDWRHMGADNVASYAYSTAAAERQVSRAAVRPVPGLDRREVERRSGVRVPEATISRRDVRMGDRTVQAVRVNGLDREIERHARTTVNRGLAPEVSRQLERREPVTSMVARPSSRPVTTERVRPLGSSPGVQRGGSALERRPAAPSRVESHSSTRSTPATRVPTRPDLERAPTTTVGREPVLRPQSAVRSEPQAVRTYRPAPSAVSRSRAPEPRAPASLERRETAPTLIRPSRPVAAQGSSRPSVTSRTTSRSLEIAPPSVASPRTVTPDRRVEPERGAGSSSQATRQSESRRPVAASSSRTSTRPAPRRRH